MDAHKRILHISGLIAMFISLVILRNLSMFEDETWTKLWVVLGMILIFSAGCSLVFSKARYVLHTSRIFAGILFIFSGFVKAVDPLGSKYKFIDYFTAWGIDFMEPMALTFGILLSVIELLAGIMLVLKIFPKYAAWAALLFMIAFTPVTLYLAFQEFITGKVLVSDCGCFGDAFILTNWQTFVKNIIILIPVVYVFKLRNTFSEITTPLKTLKLFVVFTLASFSVCFYALRNLPPLDFRPYKIGYKLVTPACTEGYSQAFDKVLFAEFTNLKTGEVQEFDINNNYPDFELWEFNVDKPIREVIVPNESINIDSLFGGRPITEVSQFLFRKGAEDYTCAIIGDPGYVFVMIAYDVTKTRTKNLDNVKDLIALSQENGYAFYGVSASLDEDVEEFKKEHSLDINFLVGDEIALKTIVRANYGLLLIKNGLIINKWHNNNVPQKAEIIQKYIQVNN